MPKRYAKYLGPRALFLFILFALLMAGEQWTLRRYDYVYQGTAFGSFVNWFNLTAVVLIALGAVPTARRWLHWLMAGALVSLFFSGGWTFLVERNSIFAFQMIAWHSFTGKIAAALFVAYMFHHIFAWAGVSDRQDIAVGFAALVVSGLALWSGVMFGVEGSHPLLGVFDFHKYFSWLIPLAFLWHAAASRRKNSPEKERTSWPALGARIGKRKTVAALGVAAALILIPMAASQRWIEIGDRLPVLLSGIPSSPGESPRYIDEPQGYSKPFGDGLFLPSNAETAPGKLIEAKFLQQSKTCAGPGCHIQIFDQWRESGHRLSRNPFVEKVMALLAEERGVEATRYCAGCHDPVNLMSGQIDPGGKPIEGEADEGVTCVICHTIDNLTQPIQTGAYVLDLTKNFFERETKTDRYMMNVLYREDHKAAFVKDFYKEPEYCAPCHRHVQPEAISSMKLTLTDKVGQWEKGVHSKADSPNGRANCLDCHMAKVEDPYKSKPQRSHRFLSSNTGLSQHYGIEKSLRDVQDYMQSKMVEVRARLSPPESGDLYRPGERAVAKVSIYNDGVGHNFPAGGPDLIEVWLQLELTNAEGKTVWSDGVPGADDQIPAGAFKYGAEFFNGSGRKLKRHEIWDIAEIRNDRVLPSGEKDGAEFSFVVPAESASPLNLRIRLRHRRLNPDFARWVYGKEDASMIVTDIEDFAFRMPVQ